MLRMILNDFSNDFCAMRTIKRRKGLCFNIPGFRDNAVKVKNNGLKRCQIKHAVKFDYARLSDEEGVASSFSSACSRS